jgi:hypothetical protein
MAGGRDPLGVRVALGLAPEGGDGNSDEFAEGVGSLAGVLEELEEFREW